jgi:hypothetical protein
MDDEQERLAQANRGDLPWRRWGPYLSERAWGTVREDYSADGDAWSYFPFEHAGSRAFRWSEDGMGGICDQEQQLCLAVALWNGKDPVLKERPYGLTGEQGNHGEDVKDYWWYLDATPTSSWLQWRYHYPQQAFPYADLLETNRPAPASSRSTSWWTPASSPRTEYWVVTATWAKGGPEDLVWRLEIRNAGPDEATIDVVPTIWFRNDWSWDAGVEAPALHLHGHDHRRRPSLDRALVADRSRRRLRRPPESRTAVLRQRHQYPQALWRRGPPFSQGRHR